MKATKKIYFKTKKITLPIQILMMKELYPGFEFHDCGINKSYWVGHLRPTSTSPKYKVRIEYFQDNYPKVFVLLPNILKNAPHRYKDGSLCLFYPKDNSFDKMTIIANTIVLWTAEWLYFYEAWLREGVWWGAEAPHEVSSKRAKKIISRHNLSRGERHGQLG